MRENKDNSAKWLLEHHGDAILRLSGVRGFTSWRAVQSELTHPKQLPDGLLEVSFPGQTSPDLFVIEVATYPERRAEDQALRDAVLVWLDRGVVPEVVTLVLHPKGQFRLSGQWQRTSRHGLTRLGGSWTVIEMWTLAAEDLLALNDVGLVPWIPLARSPLPPEELLRQCRDRIEREAKPEEQANMLAVAQVLTSVRYNDAGLLSILGGRAVLNIESPLLEELVNERLRRDLAGLLLPIMLDMLLNLLKTKFGELPEDVIDKVRAIQDVEQVRQLNTQAGVCADLNAFRAQLPS